MKAHPYKPIDGSTRCATCNSPKLAMIHAVSEPAESPDLPFVPYSATQCDHGVSLSDRCEECTLPVDPPAGSPEAAITAEQYARQLASVGRAGKPDAGAAERLYAGGSVFFRPGQEDVLTKRRASTGKEVHYFIGPIRETLSEAEQDRDRWAATASWKAEEADWKRREAELLAENAELKRSRGVVDSEAEQLARQRDALANVVEGLRWMLPKTYSASPNRQYSLNSQLSGIEIESMDEALRKAGRLQ